MKPLNNYILLEIEDENQKTSGGLYVPAGSNTNPNDLLKEGKVLAISDSIELDLNLGDIVFYNKHALTKIPGETNKILVRKEDLYLKK